MFLGFSCGSAGKESTCNVGDLGLIPGLGRSPGEGNSYPFQYSGLENSMEVHGGHKESGTNEQFLFSLFKPSTSRWLTRLYLLPWLLRYILKYSSWISLSTQKNSISEKWTLGFCSPTYLYYLVPSQPTTCQQWKAIYILPLHELAFFRIK